LLELLAAAGIADAMPLVDEEEMRVIADPRLRRRDRARDEAERPERRGQPALPIGRLDRVEESAPGEGRCRALGAPPDQNSGFLEGLAHGGPRQRANRSLEAVLLFARPAACVGTLDRAAREDVLPGHETRAGAAPPHENLRALRPPPEHDEARGEAGPNGRRPSCFSAIRR